MLNAYPEELKFKCNVFFKVNPVVARGFGLCICKVVNGFFYGYLTERCVPIKALNIKTCVF